jgi:hypothetical protein
MGTLRLRTNLIRLNIRVEQSDCRIKVTEISPIPSQPLFKLAYYSSQFRPLVAQQANNLQLRHHRSPEIPVIRMLRGAACRSDSPVVAVAT